MHFALVGKSDKRFHLLLPEKCLHYPNYGGRFADVCCLHRYPAVLWCLATLGAFLSELLPGEN